MTRIMQWNCFGKLCIFSCVYYTHPGYQTSICGKNRAYYIRIFTVTVLGVIMNDRLSASDHITYLITSCARLLYVLHVLRVHGLPQQSLNDVYRTTVQGKLLYAASRWFGFCIARDKVRLNSFLCRCWKLGYSDRNITFEDVCWCRRTAF